MHDLDYYYIVIRRYARRGPFKFVAGSINKRFARRRAYKKYWLSAFKLAERKSGPTVNNFIDTAIGYNHTCMSARRIIVVRGLFVDSRANRVMRFVMRASELYAISVCSGEKTDQRPSIFFGPNRWTSQLPRCEDIRLSRGIGEW